MAKYTKKQVRESMSKLDYEQVLDLCWTQHTTMYGENAGGLTKEMMRTFDKEALINCFIQAM